MPFIKLLIVYLQSSIYQSELFLDLMLASCQG